MAWTFLLFAMCLLFPQPISSSNRLTRGSSLSVENSKDVLVSPSGLFASGFYPIGENAYSFAIWLNKPSCTQNCTLVWMANRDFPVNGKRSTLFIQKAGALVLSDAGKSIAWSTKTSSISPANLQLQDNGNLVLQNTENVTLWQSFDNPTDTLLPGQQLTRETQLVSSLSPTNFSSGFYKLFFDNDNVLRLLYDGPDVSSTYWPDPWLQSWEANRFGYNSSRIASLDSLGEFHSSDNFTALSADYGARIQRRLTLDSDGNLRMYSRDRTENWSVSWQALSNHCKVHGICGPNSTCSNDPTVGRKCSCLPGYKMRNTTDWNFGCEPEFDSDMCDDEPVAELDFVKLAHVEFYGYDWGYRPNYTLDMCKQFCLNLCFCTGFQYKPGSGTFNCYPKISFRNGHRQYFGGDIYVKIPKSFDLLTRKVVDNAGSGLVCPGGSLEVSMDRAYSKNRVDGTVNFMLWFAVALGGVELIGVLFIWIFLMIRSRKESNENKLGYHQAPSGFRRFTYSELAKATRNFKDEIGRGAGGIVYKGRLADDRVAAIKRLYVANQGEAEFLAEISTIGRLNHMNLIDMWGYCAEGKHRLLVYEYVENGSLAENLSSNSLDWRKVFDIALGTARGLAYLHEECLEWVLHCDVKPQNILLDANYQPKVSDFGLSKLLNRGDENTSNFSSIRGTRGYMAPEWVFNLPITSKVDVYSYGIVVLEMVAGKSPAMEFSDRNSCGNSGEVAQGRLVTWIRNKRNSVGVGHGKESSLWIEEIVDPMLKGQFDATRMEFLVSLALQCVEEDKDARPTMSKVVEMLLQHQNHG